MPFTSCTFRRIEKQNRIFCYAFAIIKNTAYSLTDLSPTIRLDCSRLESQPEYLYFVRTCEAEIWSFTIAFLRQVATAILPSIDSPLASPATIQQTTYLSWSDKGKPDFGFQFLFLNFGIDFLAPFPNLKLEN